MVHSLTGGTQLNFGISREGAHYKLRKGEGEKNESRGEGGYDMQQDFNRRPGGSFFHGAHTNESNVK